MKYLCLDFGLKRIGVAVGDAKSEIAFPREALKLDELTVMKLKKFIEEEKTEKILIGNPVKHDGSEGDIVHELRQFSEQLQKESKLPIEFLDERFTSRIASQKLRSAGIAVKHQKPFQDSIAAQIMLQEWMDSF